MFKRLHIGSKSQKQTVSKDYWFPLPSSCVHIFQFCRIAFSPGTVSLTCNMSRSLLTLITNQSTIFGFFFIFPFRTSLKWSKRLANTRSVFRLSTSRQGDFISRYYDSVLTVTRYNGSHLLSGSMFL